MYIFFLFSIIILIKKKFQLKTNEIKYDWTDYADFFLNRLRDGD